MQRGIDYIGVGVGGAIFNPEGKLFLAQRGKKAKNERGKWEIPGGSVEFGETLQEALMRELQEEFGVEVEILDDLSIHNHILPDEKQHWVSASFICKLVKGEPIIQEPEKIADVGWFELSEIEKLPLSILVMGDLKILRKKYPHGIPNFY